VRHVCPAQAGWPAERPTSHQPWAPGARSARGSSLRTPCHHKGDQKLAAVGPSQDAGDETTSRWQPGASHCEGCACLLRHCPRTSEPVHMVHRDRSALNLGANLERTLDDLDLFVPNLESANAACAEQQ
jgi:hypothetical protein